jgi:hypothetical protein
MDVSQQLVVRQRLEARLNIGTVSEISKIGAT